MKIKCSGTDLASAIGQVTKMTGAKHVSFKAEGELLLVSGTEKGRTALVRVAVSIKKGGQFTSLPDGFVGLTRNRKEVVIEMDKDGSKVSLKSGNYESELTVVPFEDIQIVEPTDGTEFEMGEAELKVVMELCGKAQLTAPYKEGSPALPIHLAITSNGTQVACLDPFHVASVRSKQVTRDENLEIVLPPGALTAVAQLAEGEHHKIVFSESVVYAEGETFQIKLPLEQVDSGKLSMKHVQQLQERIKGSEPVATARVSRDQLSSILENVYAVSEADVAIVFDVSKGKMGVSTTTSYGSAKEELTAETKGSGSFKFPPSMLSELFAKVYGSGDELDLFFLDRMVYFQVRTGETNGLFVLNRAG